MAWCPQGDNNCVHAGDVHLKEKQFGQFEYLGSEYTLSNVCRFLLERRDKGLHSEDGATLGGCGGQQQIHVFPTDR